jgi:dienelactone hydrolase
LSLRLGLVLLLSALIASSCAPALKDLKPALTAVDSGNIWFASAGSLVPAPDRTRLVPGDPIVLSGDLGVPLGTGPFPAVVLAHGCAGVSAGETAWASALREWGYATFVLDSFRGRNLVEVCTDAQTLSGTQRIPDAYGALRLLGTHPRIDARRVALMGFSHGGILTVGASTTWARETFAPADRPAFRAFLPFYPYCNTVYPERERISAPLRVHTGELDDWTPAASCVRLVESLKASGQDATITLYPGAHHSFDNMGTSASYFPRVDSGAGCHFELPTILGPVPPPSEIAKCLRKGATVAPNAKATEDARRNVRSQLSELMR